VNVKKRVLIGALIVLGIMSAVSLMKFTGWNNTILFPVTHAIREILAPAQNGIASVTEFVYDFYSYFGDSETLRRENEELKKRIAVLEEKAYSLNEQELENERLYKLLEYKNEKAENYDLVLAKIIGRDPGNWYKTVTINQGSNGGIQKDMAVVTHDGLVGMVIAAAPNISEVLLIIDTESAVGARILENRVSPGIAVGTGKSDFLQMIRLPHDAPLEIGQTIISSGLGSLYPEGIRLGEVAEVALEPNGLIKNAKITPAVDFDRLEEVFVIRAVYKNEAELPLTGASQPEQGQESSS
jgi:rod shape-determining protein MreC